MSAIKGRTSCDTVLATVLIDCTSKEPAAAERSNWEKYEDAFEE